METKPGDKPLLPPGEAAPTERPDNDRRTGICDPVSEPAVDPLVFMGMRWNLLHVTAPTGVRSVLSPRAGTLPYGEPVPGALP